LSLPSSSFSCVVDKGLLDAMAHGDVSNVTAMFHEVDRVLAKGGVHLTVSLTQDDALDQWRHFYNTHAYVPSATLCDRSFTCDETQLAMPSGKHAVHLLVATKHS